MRQARLVLILAAGLAACAAWPRGADAQDALGAGDALDANPFANAPGRNPLAPVEDFNARNLIVTDSVADGRGFRGTVGYRAEFDFRGELGSNDLYLERANMALSDPNLLGAGRTFERLRYGQYLGAFEFRRAGRGAHLGSLRESRLSAAQIADDRLFLDRISLSSTSQMLYETISDAEIVGSVRDQDGQSYVASASSLGGIQLTPTQAQVQLIGLTSYDMARIIADGQAGLDISGVGRPFERQFAETAPGADAMLSGRIERETPEAGMIVTGSPQYESILEAVVERAASTWQTDISDGTGLVTRLEEELAALAAQLEAAEQEAMETGAAQPEAAQPGAPEAIPGTPPPPKVEELAGPLRHGRRIESLVTDDESRFNELLSSAQEKLRNGEYFWAERRFTRALRFTPDHPLATAGMANAQLGAGLWAPAALTLRNLFTRNPEMIDVRYGPDLLPSRVRISVAVRDLQRLIATVERDRALHGFLLAYIGHQVADRSLVAEGLAAMKAASPDDRLYGLLEAIWLP